MQEREMLMPLGAAAAAAQFTGVAIKAIKLIKDICSGVKDAPEAIKRHIGQLETLNDTAAKVRDNSTLAADPATEAILRECTATVSDVASLLKSVKASDGDNLVQRGWKAVAGMSREQEIVRLLDDLERSKTSLLVRITTVNSSQSDIIIQSQQKHGKSLAVIQSMLEVTQIAGDEEQSFLRAMFLTDPRGDRSALLSVKGDRVEGTCTWVTESKAYRTWLNSACQGLWILGGPGMGKSMMSIFLTQHLEASVRTQHTGTVIYFFYDNRDFHKNNAAAVLRGLIWQLARLRPQLVRHGLAELRSRGGRPETLHGVDALWRIFCEMVDDSKSGQVYCVIDGLDECVEGGVNPIIELLSKKDPSPNFKPIILSRPLQDVPTTVLKSLVRLRLDPDSADQISADLKTFIQERVAELSEAKRYPSSLRQLVEETFAKKSESTFLWVGFAARELRTVPINDVERYLASLPSGLSGIYDRIFKNIHPNHVQRVQQVLLLAVIAYRPLDLEEVASMLNIRPSETLTSIEVVQSITSQCENLVVVVDGKINLVHQSKNRGDAPGRPIKKNISETMQKDSGDELVGIEARVLPFFASRFIYLYQKFVEERSVRWLTEAELRYNWQLYTETTVS
ncbi:ankyrin repeat protein [Colletotrichum sojae]|uniref:Ankyrin repeat protein n=1 Tax=Colletotrichum sojae TaxID=2175907 RepID=A0A8H6IVF9_9PEZI|nr:ankyrin repeat protein [Colletotrichum sojae]